MICWSCEKDAGTAMLCSGCGAPQAPSPGGDHFRVLGVERGFDLDLADLERRYKDLTKVLHPDRFARADARARRASLAQSVRINEAWRVLRDPVRRAEYLLSLVGYDVGGEQGTTRTSASGEKERMSVPQALLLETMELRETLAEAQAAADMAQVQALARDVTGRRDAALAEVARGFAAAAPDHDAIAAKLVAIRYYARFLDEVAMIEESLAGVQPGGAHAG